MKKETITLIVIFAITAIILTTPMILPVVAGNTSSFNVTLTINSGDPTINAVASASGSPNEGATNDIHVYFNASHPNGVINIPNTLAVVKFNKSGSATITSTSCSATPLDSVKNQYDCTVTIDYTTLPGTWTINASIADLAGTRVSDLSATYLNGITYGVRLTQPSLGFTGAPGDPNVNSAQNPQVVNNTGNWAYTQINLTAFNLASGSNTIGATNFTANTTINAGGNGQTLGNNTPVTLIDSAVAVGATKNVYVYLDIPNGVANGTYTNVNPWVVTLS